MQYSTINRLDYYSALQTILVSIDPYATDWTLFKKDKVNRQRFLKYINSERFDNAISSSFLLRIKSIFPQKEIIISNDQIENFKQSYPSVIEMNRQLINSIVNGLTLECVEHSRWNTFNDIMIILTSKLNSDKWILISDDSQIKTAYQNCGQGESIKNLSEYLELINF